MTVVVIADNAGSADSLARLARQLGHRVWTVLGTAHAMTSAQEAQPDAVLVALDAESQVLRGVIDRVRAVAPGVPVLLALPDDSWWLRSPPGSLMPVATVRRAGLGAGALSSAFARLGLHGGTREAPAALRLDAAARLLDGPRGRAHLTPAEGALISLLLGAEGEVVRHQDMAREIWGGEPIDRPRMVALRTHVYEVRRKLEAVGAPGSLLSEPGRGYRLAMS